MDVFPEDEEASSSSWTDHVGGDTINGAVDFKGRPVLRSKSGGWLSGFLIIVVQLLERFAFFGISSNLISYLTGAMGQSKAVAAENVNTWGGVAMLSPLLGAFVADSYLGRYPTILVASIIYILFYVDALRLVDGSHLAHYNYIGSACPVTQKHFEGLGLLTLSTVLPSQYEVTLFFFSLYLVALAQGGFRPCVVAFGADQFDEQDSEERTAKSSFFNWSNLGVGFGIASAYLFLNYIQDNLTWVLGFGIPCISVSFGLGVFFIGTRTYRFHVKDQGGINPFVRIYKGFLIVARNRRNGFLLTNEEVDQGVVPQFGVVDRPLLASTCSAEEGETFGRDVEDDAKAVLKLLTVCVTCLPYAIVYAQTSTFFTEQAVTMDRTIWAGFVIPPASLQLFTSAAILLSIPVYDLIFVPLARRLTGEPSGITMLQRIGAGIFTSMVGMVVCAFVEMRRLRVAREYGIVEYPGVTVPMSFLWLVPQYLLFGIADVFAAIGMQEFFYDEVPNDLKSVGISIYIGVLGLGSFLSSFLISVIENATGGEGHYSWFSDNLNRAHLDYFYWFLAAISAVGFLGYLYFTKSYVYRRSG